MFNGFIISCVTCLFTILIIKPYWGFYDSFAAFLLSGRSTGVSLVHTYHLGYFPITHLIAFLHEFFFYVPWMAILMLLSWIITVSNIFTLFLEHNQLFSFRHNVWKLIVLFIVFFLMSFIEFSATNTSMALISSSLIFLVFKNQNDWDWRRKIVFQIWVLTAIFISVSFRMETASIAAVLTLLFILIIDYRKILSIKVLFAFLFIIVMVFFIGRSSENHPFFKNIDWMIFYVVDAKNEFDVNINNPIDEVKLKTVKMSFFSDTSILNYDYYKDLFDLKVEHQTKFFNNFYKDFENATYLMSKAIVENIRYSTYYLVILIFTLHILYLLQKNKSFIQVTMVTIIIFLVFFSLAFTMKMERWHYVPLIQTSLMFYLTIIILNLDLSLVFNNNIGRATFFLTALLVISLFYFEVKSRTSEIYEKIEVREEIFRHGKDRYIFFDVNTREVLDDFVFIKMLPIKNVYLYDMAQLTFTKEYKPYLDAFCDCDAHIMPEFFNGIQNKLDSIDYYSSPYRVSTLSSYLELVHGMKVNFIPKEKYYLKKNKFGINEFINYSVEVE